MEKSGKKSIAVVIFANQNDVSAAEIRKITSRVKRDFPDYELAVYANDDAADLVNREHGYVDTAEDESIVFHTFDVNGEVWARLEDNQSTISSKNTWNIPL